jgi:hypothetical protein
VCGMHAVLLLPLPLRLSFPFSTPALNPPSPLSSSTPSLQFGGQDVAANGNLNIRACSESIRLRVSTSPTGAYSFHDGWEVEFMGSSRVMGDATILPNGVVILMNGAQNGLAGDSASGGGR